MVCETLINKKINVQIVCCQPFDENMRALIIDFG